MKHSLSAVLLASALGVTLPALAANLTIGSNPGLTQLSAQSAARAPAADLMLAADSDADQNAAMPNNPRARDEVGEHRADIDRGHAEHPDVDHDRAERPEADEVHADVDHPDVDRPDVDRPNVDRPDVERPSVERPETDR